MPASIAARMIEVPSGTVTLLAVDGQRDHGFADLRARRAVIDFLDQRHGDRSLIPRPAGASAPAPKSSGKWVSALITG